MEQYKMMEKALMRERAKTQKLSQTLCRYEERYVDCKAKLLDCIVFHPLCDKVSEPDYKLDGTFVAHEQKQIPDRDIEMEIKWEICGKRRNDSCAPAEAQQKKRKRKKKRKPECDEDDQLQLEFENETLEEKSHSSREMVAETQYVDQYFVLGSEGTRTSTPNHGLLKPEDIRGGFDVKQQLQKILDQKNTQLPVSPLVLSDASISPDTSIYNPRCQQYAVTRHVRKSLPFTYETEHVPDSHEEHVKSSANSDNDQVKRLNITLSELDLINRAVDEYEPDLLASSISEARIVSKPDSEIDVLGKLVASSSSSSDSDDDDTAGVDYIRPCRPLLLKGRYWYSKVKKGTSLAAKSNVEECNEHKAKPFVSDSKMATTSPQEITFSDETLVRAPEVNGNDICQIHDIPMHRDIEEHLDPRHCIILNGVLCRKGSQACETVEHSTNRDVVEIDVGTVTNLQAAGKQEGTNPEVNLEAGKQEGTNPEVNLEAGKQEGTNSEVNLEAGKQEGTNPDVAKQHITIYEDSERKAYNEGNYAAEKIVRMIGQTAHRVENEEAHTANRTMNQISQNSNGQTLDKSMKEGTDTASKTLEKTIMLQSKPSSAKNKLINNPMIHTRIALKKKSKRNCSKTKMSNPVSPSEQAVMPASHKKSPKKKQSSSSLQKVDVPFIKSPKDESAVIDLFKIPAIEYTVAKVHNADNKPETSQYLNTTFTVSPYESSPVAALPGHSSDDIDVVTHNEAPEVNPPSKTSEVKPLIKPFEVKLPKPPSKTPEVKSPSKTHEVKPPSKTSEVKLPSKTCKVKPPSKTGPDVKPPHKISDANPPSKTSEVKSPSKTPEVKPPSKIFEVKPPSKIPEVKAPCKTPEVKQPSKIPEATAPSKTPEVKPPSKTTEVKPPSKPFGIKPPNKPPEVKPPSKTTEVTPPSKPTEVKPPCKTSEVKPPCKTPEVKSPNKTPEVKPPNKTSEVKPLNKTSEVNLHNKTFEVKSPSNTSGVMPPSKTCEAKPPSKTSEVQPQSKTSWFKPPDNISEVNLHNKTFEVKSPSKTSGVVPPSKTCEVEPHDKISDANPSCNTTEIKPHIKTSEVKLHGKTSMIKPPDKIYDANPPINTSEVKPTSKVSEVMKPSKISDANPPSSTTEIRPHSKTSEVKAPSKKSAEVKSHSKISEVKPTSKRSEVKSPSKTSDANPPRTPYEVKPHNIASEVKPHDIASEIKPQSIASKVKPQNIASEVKPHNIASEIKPQSIASKVKPQNIASEDKPPSIAPEVKPQSIASKVKPQSIASEVKPLSITSEVKQQSIASKVKPQSITSEVKPLSITLEVKPHRMTYSIQSTSETPEVSEPKAKSLTKSSLLSDAVEKKMPKIRFNKVTSLAQECVSTLDSNDERSSVSPGEHSQSIAQNKKVITPRKMSGLSGIRGLQKISISRRSNDATQCSPCQLQNNESQPVKESCPNHFSGNSNRPEDIDRRIQHTGQKDTTVCSNRPPTPSVSETGQISPTKSPTKSVRKNKKPGKKSNNVAVRSVHNVANPISTQRSDRAGHNVNSQETQTSGREPNYPNSSRAAPPHDQCPCPSRAPPHLQPLWDMTSTSYLKEWSQEKCLPLHRLERKTDRMPEHHTSTKVDRSPSRRPEQSPRKHQQCDGASRCKLDTMDGSHRNVYINISQANFHCAGQEHGNVSTQLNRATTNPYPHVQSGQAHGKKPCPHVQSGQAHGKTNHFKEAAKKNIRKKNYNVVQPIQCDSPVVNKGAVKANNKDLPPLLNAPKIYECDDKAGNSNT